MLANTHKLMSSLGIRVDRFSGVVCTKQGLHQLAQSTVLSGLRRRSVQTSVNMAGDTDLSTNLDCVIVIS